jgi:hypothetical protein
MKRQSTDAGDLPDTRYFGAEVSAALADGVDAVCEKHHFTKKDLIQAVFEHFLSLPDSIQIDIYHRRRDRCETLRKDIVAVLQDLQLLPEQQKTNKVSK